MLPATSFRCVDCEHNCPYDCTEWVGKECGNPSQYGVFDVDAEACADAEPYCLNPPPPPHPPPPDASAYLPSGGAAGVPLTFG